MGKNKDNKTNAMRILDKNGIRYELETYECDEFHNGMQIADMLGNPYERSYKTLVAVGRSREYYVFVIPVDKELNLKAAAKSVGEKNVELIHVKDINRITGYIRGGCTPIGMKKSFPTVIYEEARSFDTIIVSGGRIGMHLTLSPLDLAEVCHAKFDDIIFHES